MDLVAETGDFFEIIATDPSLKTPADGDCWRGKRQRRSGREPR